MTNRENLFRPVHKGIRAMIYDSAQRLQALDFTNVAESNEFATRLKRDLGASASNCLLCLLRAHSIHEEKEIFTEVHRFDPEIVKLMMAEHAEVAKRVRVLDTTCNDLMKVTDPARRIEVGDRLDLEANDLFAFYLSHLNNEEATVVPIMWERFTDAQLRTLRAKFYDNIPLPRFEEWMRWTLPALNLNELEVIFSGLKQDPGAARFKDWVRMAKQTLDPERWRALDRLVSLSIT